MDDDLDRSVIHQLSSSFVLARQSAQALLKLYSDNGVSLNPQCSLAQLITHGIKLADDWEQGVPVGDDVAEAIVQGQHLDKIAWAALPLANVPDRVKHLTELKRGNLDPAHRDRSPAKDKLWELEVWQQFWHRGIEATLDEPDVVATTPIGPIAVACKRIYSLSNATNPISKGVKQIEASGLPGILSLCVEDVYIPPGHLVHAPNIVIAAAGLNDFNIAFANEFHGALVRYLSTGRASCVAISTCAPIYLDDEGIRECRQTLFWTHPQLSADKLSHMHEMSAFLFGDET